MTDKELQRLSRGELLQMLIAQMEENKALQDRLDQAEKKLKSREIVVNNAGSLAEAALSLNGVFQAAEAAAHQYLENIQRMSSQQEAVCKNMQLEAEKNAADIVQRAQIYSQNVHAEADNYWQQVKEKAASVLQSQDALREFVLSAGKNKE